MKHTLEAVHSFKSSFTWKDVEDFVAVHQSTWALGSKDHFVPRNENGLDK